MQFDSFHYIVQFDTLVILLNLRSHWVPSVYDPLAFIVLFDQHILSLAAQMSRSVPVNHRDLMCDIYAEVSVDSATLFSIDVLSPPRDTDVGYLHQGRV